MNGFNHFDAQGKAIMVDVTDKAATHRVAEARGEILVNEAVMTAIQTGTAKKGDVLGVARVAGIMAVKRTSDLIPMCHPLAVSGCSVDFQLFPEEGKVEAVCTVKVTGNTGVEMEALTGVSAALLTIYDMCKAVDRAMTLTNIRLMRKGLLAVRPGGGLRLRHLLPLALSAGAADSRRVRAGLFSGFSRGGCDLAGGI